MKSLCAAAIAGMTLLCSPIALASVAGGKATGALVVNGTKTPLQSSYVVSKNSLLRVILASAPLEEEELYANDALQSAVDGRGVSAVVIQLDEDRHADETYFFNSKL
ncbi:MAG: hypothetical protein ABI837_15140, partial [Acidobacteriota bacterium]